MLRGKTHLDAGSKAVGIWIRVSTEDQVRGESPEHHERRARLYAEAKGWEVREVYRLDAVSGKDVMDHPETQRMLSDVRTRRITGLVFSKLARLARNTKQLLDFAEIFHKEEADLISLQESIDTSTPAGRLFYTMIAAMAQWEREEIASRVAASIPIRARLGKQISGRPSFGYQWVNKKLVPHPKEAPIRRLVYELFLEHRRLKAVARILNEAGHRTRTGKRFSDTTVERLIQDPTAKGVRRANYTRNLGGNKGWTFKPQDEWVLLEVPAIISPELWDQCNALLDERKKNKKAVTKRPVHLFAGLVRCACGGKMAVPSNSPKFVCKTCLRKIRQDDLEAIFEEQLKGFVFSPQQITAYLESADERIKEKQDLLGNLETEQQKVTQEMTKTHRLYIEDKLSGDGFGKLYRPLEERLKALEDQIPSVQAELDFLKIQAVSSDEIFAEARDLHARWADLSREDKHHIIEAVTDSIVVSKDEVAINLAYLPKSVPAPSQERGALATRSWV